MVIVEKKGLYSVAFVGLKDGIHEFDFHFDQMFFDSFENALLDKCDISGKVVLNKKATMLESEFLHKGNAWFNCDRCGEEISLEIEASNPLIFKYSHLEESDSDEVVFISQDQTEIDFGPFFYEFISLSLPARRVHPEGECNEDIIALLDEINSNESEETDPRWDALKKLKNKDL